MSLIYHIDVVCDQCGAVLPYAASSRSSKKPGALVAIHRARDAGWSHSVVRDLCPNCRPPARAHHARSQALHGTPRERRTP